VIYQKKKKTIAKRFLFAPSRKFSKNKMDLQVLKENNNKIKEF